MLESISILLMPQFNNVFPGFVICRVIHSLFLTAGFATPLTGDYIRIETLGIAAGIRFFFTALGALLGAGFIKLMLHITTI